MAARSKLPKQTAPSRVLERKGFLFVERHRWVPQVLEFVDIYIDCRK